MQTKKRHPWIALINVLLFFTVFIIHYTDIIDISIKNANPLIILPLITAFSMFSQPGAAAAAGLASGVLMDSSASGAICFNAIVIMLSAVCVSVCSNNLFNRNIRSAVMLSVLISLIYFLLRWVIFYAFKNGAHDNLTYILSYAFPSILYTNLFIFPFYFLYRYFDKRINS